MNLKLSAAGFAVQTAKGAAATQPQFFGPVAGGNLVTFEVEQTEDELTSAEIGGIGEFRQSAGVAADWEGRAWPVSIAGLLYAVLGDLDSSGGAPAVPAVYTTALTGTNNDLTFLAKTPGVGGNSITVALVDPQGNDQALAVSVNSQAISVSLATGPAGAITSTATDVKNALNAHAGAKALIVASVAPGNSGKGVVTALTAKNLAGGAAASGGGSYTHVIEPAAEVPWCTVFGKKDGDRKAASDCKLDELKVEWEGNQPLKVTSTWAGVNASWSEVEYVPGVDEALVDYLKGINLNGSLDLDGNAYDGGAKILGGSVTIKRNLEADFYSGDLLAGNILEGDLEVDVELKVRVPDLLPVRLLVTGAVDGDEPAADVPYGGVSLAFTAGADSLTIAADRVAWKASEPEADPKGGPAELTLQGRCYGNPAITATVINTFETYATA